MKPTAQKQPPAQAAQALFPLSRQGHYLHGASKRFCLVATDEQTAREVETACNQHAALVAALQETVRSMEWVISAFPDIPANCNFSEVLAEARAALALAGGAK